MSTLFYDFGRVCEALAATTKKLEKAALLKPYFAALDDADLQLAARFLAGRPFPLADQRVLNVGWSLVRDVVCGLSGAEPAEFAALSTSMGEPGSAAEVVLQGHSAATPSLTLAELHAAYEALAVARGPSGKRPLLSELLSRATPLEAKYIIKIMGGDLRIGMQEGQLEDAIARYAGVSVAEVQWANMLLGDVGETALLARLHRLGDARMRLFHPLKFMLASPVQDPEEIRRSITGSFFVEDKYDGIRAQLHKADGRVAIFSRTLDEITHRFPELLPAAQALPGDLIIDGEILAARDGVILPFKELQPRLGRKNVSAELLAQIPVILVAYDLLYDGEVLLERPLAERRQRLERLLAQGIADGPLLPSLMNSVDDVSRIDELFDAARARGNEGLMVKDPASIYKPGRRGREWLKVKRSLGSLDVVVTAVEVGNGRRRHLLSDYTFAVRASESDPTLLNVGKAYSGLTDAELSELTEWFKAHTIKNFGRVRLVEPKVVLEVTFDIVQPSARHKSGYALRFPRIVRLRTDKSADEIDTLETVRRLVDGGAAQADPGAGDPGSASV